VKPSGGGADVDAALAGEVDVPVVEGFFELQAAAADEFEVVAEEAEDGGVVDGSARLVDALVVHEDAAGEDEGVGALAGLREAAVDEELVEADAGLRMGTGDFRERHGLLKCMPWIGCVAMVRRPTSFGDFL